MFTHNPVRHHMERGHPESPVWKKGSQLTEQYFLITTVSLAHVIISTLIQGFIFPGGPKLKLNIGKETHPTFTKLIHFLDKVSLCLLCSDKKYINICKQRS